MQPFFRCGGNGSAAQNRNGVHFGSDMRMRYPGSTSPIDMVYKGFVYAKMREKEREGEKKKKEGLQLSCVWRPMESASLAACYDSSSYGLLCMGNNSVYTIVLG